MQLKEKIDFSFSIKDFSEVTSIAENYLKERAIVFEELFLNSSTKYNENDIIDYLDAFISPLKEGSSPNTQKGRIIHFLEREYELFLFPSISPIIEDLHFLISLQAEDYQDQNFIEFEDEVIKKIIDLWQTLYTKIIESPYTLIKSFKKDILCGVTSYYKENGIDPELLEEYIIFINNMNTIFPKTLKRIDSILFMPQSYIDFVAGEGTTAFFINDEIFMPEKIAEKDKDFFMETLYHEFGHFIFSLLTESTQIYWYKQYDAWIDKGVKLTRDAGKNDVEELFADGFSRIFSPVHDFIQEPNPIILDTVKYILEEEF